MFSIARNVDIVDGVRVQDHDVRLRLKIGQHGDELCLGQFPLLGRPMDAHEQERQCIIGGEEIDQGWQFWL
jgi:hypothetical protein